MREIPTSRQPRKPAQWLRAARALLATTLLSVPIAAGASTALWFQSLPGDYIGRGETRLFSTPGDVLLATRNYHEGVSVRVTSGDEWWYLDLAGPGRARLEPGAYEGAARFPFQGNIPGLDMSGDGRGCNTVAGRFTVLEATYGPDGSVVSFAANFEHRCEEIGPPLFGEIRVNSAVPFTHLEPPGSVMPDAFDFRPASLLLPGTLVESGETTIYGINAPAPIAITGGEYSVNGGAWTSAAGVVANRDRVRLRVTSPVVPGGTAAAVLTVGGVSASFIATNYLPGEPLTALWFQSPPGDYIGRGETRLFSTPGDVLLATRNYHEGVSVRVTSGDEWWYLDLAGPGRARLEPGAYEGAARFPFQENLPGLAMSGDGRGCNTVAGRFTVLEATYGPDGSVKSFAANFEHRCEEIGPPLRGEIRIASSVPLGWQLDPAADYDGDGIANGIESALARDPFVKDNDIFSPGAGSARLFAMRQCRDFLAIECDPSVIQVWTDLVASGAVSRAAAVDAFLRTDHFGGVYEPLARLYLATFLRVPDYAGIVFNAGLVRDGTVTLPQLADYFAASPEFQATYGSLDDTQFVTLLYDNVLGRSPDAPGLEGWLAFLQSGYSRGQVLLGFSESPEYRAATANETFVTLLYCGLLRRDLDPPGYAGWVAWLDGGGTRELAIEFFLSAAEYRRRFLP